MPDELNQGVMPTEPPANAQATGAMVNIAVDELDKMRRALTEANKEAATRRKQLEAYEKAETERKQAEMTDAEKWKAQADQLNKQLEQVRTEAAIAAAKNETFSLASGLGFIDPDVAFELIKSKLALDEHGHYLGVENALKELASKKPFLIKSAPALGATNPVEASQSETDAQRRQRIFGNPNSVFSSTAARNNGGGVVAPKNP